MRSRNFAKFREWDNCGGLIGAGSNFVMSADALSHSDNECAEMLMDHWEEEFHPLESGETLVIFERLVIPAPNPDIWSAISDTMEKAFGPRGGTMVLKAFPLEWEGEADGQPVENETSFDRRLAAMKKLYRRRLGMRDVPDNEEGWMWKAIGHSLPPSDKRVRQPDALTADL